jgi:SAM-dependent methyltransferase
MADHTTLRIQRDRDFLAEFLRRYWFAPPVAFWRAIEAGALSALDFPAPLLDFGCGDGLFTGAVFGKQPGVFGCDIAVGELPGARDSGVYAAGVQFADGHALPYRSGAFGSVYANSVVEHIPDPQRVLPELARVLRPGGLLILTVPSDRFHSLLHGVKTAPNPAAARAYAEGVDRLFAHHHYHTPGEWRALFRDAGLDLTQATYYVSPEAAAMWDRMNGEFGIGRRAIYSIAASPRLRRLGYQGWLARQMAAWLDRRLRPLVQAPAGDGGAGLLVVGRRA